ncbi:hypothetical protein TNIN_100831 [Trichonephila inaurata madagascariensis]|uniref:EMI domain-containing protein n=1 Tax=Trichonephila inaurata madagascariensis TaxID=2747483 RepID=A0A8X6MFZ5_9ARAC|nr:hypothetical protein TNIN_100831 [Trichonephila inaurata madagascariensis]
MMCSGGSYFTPSMTSDRSKWPPSTNAREGKHIVHPVYLSLQFQWYIVVILFTITSFSVEEDNKNEGPVVNHLCSKLESYTVEEEVTYNETYQETVKEWCLSIPPRCTRFKTLYRKVNKTIPVTKTKIVFECCDGYEKIQDKCVAVCKDGCVNGECVSPNICSCDEGWQGSNCTQGQPYHLNLYNQGFIKF